MEFQSKGENISMFSTSTAALPKTTDHFSSSSSFLSIVSFDQSHWRQQSNAVVLVVSCLLFPKLLIVIAHEMV